MSTTVGVSRTDTISAPDALWGMPQPVALVPKKTRSSARDQVYRQITECTENFAWGVARLMERNEIEPQDVGALMRQVLEKLADTSRNTAPPKPHASVWAALTLSVTVLVLMFNAAFWFGGLSNRVAQVETLAPRISQLERRSESSDVANEKLGEKIDALRRDIDRLFDAKRTR